MKLQLFWLFLSCFLGYFFLKFFAKKIGWNNVFHFLEREIVFLRFLLVFTIFIAFDNDFLSNAPPPKEQLSFFTGKVVSYKSERAKRKNVELINNDGKRVIFSSFTIVPPSDMDRLINGKEVTVYYYERESLFFFEKNILMAKSDFFNYDNYERHKGYDTWLFWFSFNLFGFIFLLSFIPRRVWNKKIF